MKSKKQSKTTTGKQPPDEPPIIFLDRTFGRYELAGQLRNAGFLLVTIYEEFGDDECRIADPVLIADCGLKNRVLLTGDQDLAYTWAKEIAEASIAVFVTTNNNESPKQWGPRIIAAKDDILRELSRRDRPFVGRISKDGRVSSLRLFDGAQWRQINVSGKTPKKLKKSSRHV